MPSDYPGAGATEVRNDAGTVVADENGLTITGGALVVANPGGTVIIDGTSDMFRIGASGTLSVLNLATGTWASTTTDVTIASSDTMLLMGAVGTSSSAYGARAPNIYATFSGRFVAVSSGGTATQRALVAADYADLSVSQMTSTVQRVSLTFYQETGTPQSRYARYYLLKQTAI